MFDLLIKNGNILDGTGRPPYKSDVAIKNGRIVQIGQFGFFGDDIPMIDATDKYVSPGFIDTHSHADAAAFLYPGCDSYLRQGITTFIGGQCGDCSAPINKFWHRKFWEYDLWNDIDPFIFYPKTVQPADKVIDVIYKKTGYKVSWGSFTQYVQAVEKAGLGCNMIYLAGHSQLRADVTGADGDRRLSATELNKIKDNIIEAFSAGAWGFSTGLDYPPSAYADIQEITELTRFVKDLGGVYSTHWKRTGLRVGTPQKPDKLRGIQDALDIALDVGIKTEIAHLTTGFDVYPQNSQMDIYSALVTLEMIDSYISKGADVAFDVIPGTSGGICTVPHLASLFMPWVKQSGGLDGLVRNLHAADYRSSLIEYLCAGRWFNLNPVADPAWDKKILITRSDNEYYTGKTIRQISEEEGKGSLELTLIMLRDDPRIMIETVHKSHEEIRTLLKHPRASVCTDTFAFDLVGSYGVDSEFPELLPHPHTYCAFPKYILSYGMDKLEDTIQKITGGPATFFDIKGRGMIQEGFYADLVIFDLNKLKTNESFIEPRVYPEGIDYVIVNGKIAVDSGELTGEKAGQILKR